MSDSLAIAAVTASLAELLAGPLDATVPGARVTARRPGASELTSGEPLLNLVLLTAEPVTELRRPPRPGAGLAPLSLRLTYLISTRGDEAKQEPERLLGAALGALHAQPVVSPALVAAASAGAPWLAGCALAASGETIRLTAVPLGAERMAGLAAALGAPGVPGALYEVSPVPLALS
jgi:hypothetical protein